MDLKHIHVNARTGDPDTSQEAAAAFEADQAKAQRSVRTVIEILGTYGSMNDFHLREIWPHYWVGPFSDHLPRNARHWARQQGYVKHTGYGRHHRHRCRVWGLGKDMITEPVCCPACGRKTRAQAVIDKIRNYLER
jgi:hypothetical protein